MTTYYARAYNATTGCWSTGCSSVTVVDLSDPAVTVHGGGLYCTNATLTATGGTGGTIYWQGITSNGTSMATPSTSQNVTVSGTYYFRAWNSCTWGTQGSAVVTIDCTPGPVTVTGCGSICFGSSCTLTATGGTFGTIYWQGTTDEGTSMGTPATSMVVSTSGTYYFRAHNDLVGWGPDGSTTIIVNALPSDPFIVATSSTLCSGNSSTLSASVSDSRIFWYSGSCNGTQVGIGNVLVVSPTITTTYFARAYDTITGCWSNDCGSMVITVNGPVPQTITGSTPICVGAITTWSSTTTGGTWTNDNPSVAAIDNATGLIYGLSTGTTVVTYNVTYGGCTSTATKTLTVLGTMGASISGGASPICYNSNPGSFTAIGTGGSGSYTYQWYTTPSTLINNATNSTYNPGNITTTTGYYCVITGSCGSGTSNTIDITVNSELLATLTGGTSPICDKSNPGILTTHASGGTGSYTYQWYRTSSGLINNATNSTYNPGMMTTSNGFYCIVTSSPCGSDTTSTFSVVVTPQVSNPTPITVAVGSTEPSCQITNGTTTTYETTASNNSGFHWSISNPSAGSIDSTTGVMTWANGFYGTVNIQVFAYGCGLPSSQVIRTVTIYQQPTAEAGTKATFTGTPIQIGSASNGPGTISWLPTAGLSNPSIAEPTASPSVTTTYTVSVNNNGCIATDTVTIVFSGYMISGKTRYLGRANVGNPVPNQPSYNSVIYDISKVIVILKNYPTGTEISRDTSNTVGSYAFNNIPAGTYKLTYKKWAADTMQWVNGVDAIDVTLLKYYVGVDTLLDPTRCFSWKYKRAADVDNINSINSIDIARIKNKIGSPYTVSRNFPKGNWVSYDTLVTITNANLNVTLKTDAYGDFNASSNKYRDSVSTWSLAKSLPENIIDVSGDYIMTNDPSYIEVPLRISSKMKDFSALGLELNYPSNEYQLVNAFMVNNSTKNTSVKINPSLEEIIADDNDLLVTDESGVIRVVFATTNDYDVDANDEIIKLGFRARTDRNIHGELDFELSGTGVIGNKYGEENEEAFLIMPKIFVQSNDNDVEAGFEFAGYPNPFNGDATLTYSIPQDGTVKLNVYNAIGELVGTLVSDSQTSGKHTVSYEPKNLPAGMYTFRLEYTSGDKSKCMILKMIH